MGTHQTAGNERYAKSASWYERSKKSLAGGVSSQFRALSIPHPMFYERALGSRIWDVDGNELIDFTLSQGPCILGHSHPELLERVTAAMARGQLYAGQHEDEVLLAERLQKLIPCAERVRFSSSGSEAAHSVLRLARHITGKAKFIKFEGHYHGWFDNVSFNVAPPRQLLNNDSAPGVVPWGGGIPVSLQDDVIPSRWNDLEAVRRLVQERAGEIGAIITEPVMCNQGCIEPAPGFLQGLRDLCDEHGIVLIFDEIITGFRIDLGGAQRHYGVTPDLAYFGKALASGFPLSAIVGKERFMRSLELGEVFHAGTMNGNNACVAAGLATLDILEHDGAKAHRHLIGMGRSLRDGIAEIAGRSNHQILVQGPGPMFHVGFTTRSRVGDYRDVLDYDRALYGEFCRRMLARNIRLIERGLWYVSVAHTQSDIRTCLDAVEGVLAEMSGK